MLDRYRAIGLTAAARETGVDAKTIRVWHEAAGGTKDDRDDITRKTTEHQRLASAAYHAKVHAERTAAHDRAIERLIKMSEVAMAREMEILINGEFTREDLQAVTNTRTKAIQQIELLSGRATSRNEIGTEHIVQGVVMAFRSTLELLAGAGVAQAIIDRATDHFASQMRSVEKENVLELEAGDVEEVDVAEGS